MAMTGSRPYAGINKHLASWGMYVCADHTQGAASGKDATSCLDAIKEKDEFKPYLSGKMATAGHSMGGGGAVNGASRNEVSAFVSMQTCAPAGGEGLKKAGLYLTGTADWFNCKSMTGSTYKNHKGKGFYAVYKGAGHTDTPMGRGAGVDAYRGISAAWLHCWGSGVSSACKLFKGEENAPIKDQGSWVELKSKNI